MAERCHPDHDLWHLRFTGPDGTVYRVQTRDPNATTSKHEGEVPAQSPPGGPYYVLVGDECYAIHTTDPSTTVAATTTG